MARPSTKRKQEYALAKSPGGVSKKAKLNWPSGDEIKPISTLQFHLDGWDFAYDSAKNGFCNIHKRNVNKNCAGDEKSHTPV